MANKNLNAAKVAKKDEFYTQLSDIERELQHYWQHFRGKVVLCNCDDPYESNFFKYFALRFNQLGLKKLMQIGTDRFRGGGLAKASIMSATNAYRSEESPVCPEVLRRALSGQVWQTACPPLTPRRR